MFAGRLRRFQQNQTPGPLGARLYPKDMWGAGRPAVFGPRADAGELPREFWRLWESWEAGGM